VWTAESLALCRWLLLIDWWSAWC